MTFEDPRQDRTALRLQLYANGFTPPLGWDLDDRRAMQLLLHPTELG